jgi:hypothetical protein
MNSTSVSTSWTTERCTSSGSAFHRSGDDLLAACSISRRRASSSSTSVTVTLPLRTTTRWRGARVTFARRFTETRLRDGAFDVDRFAMNHEPTIPRSKM